MTREYHEGYQQGYKDAKEEGQEPTTKNDSSSLEKNSKKLEKGTAKNDLGVDCISRESVLELLNDYRDKHFENRQEYPVNYGTLLDILRWIRNLPSVKPRLSVPEVTALAEWTEKLTKASEDAYNKGYADGMKAQEPRKGHWINTANPRMSDNIVCSECGYDSIADFKFCPCCGADMRGVEE